MMPEGVRWKARLSKIEHKWHRVEVDGPPPPLVDADPVVLSMALALVGDADLSKFAVPVALVKDRAHAVAIAALPLVTEALRGFLAADESESEDLYRQAISLAKAALAAVEGR